MDLLGDLNIVAIAATPKVQPIKRKKTNKYERRRQKAENAKRGQKLRKGKTHILTAKDDSNDENNSNQDLSGYHDADAGADPDTREEGSVLTPKTGSSSAASDESLSPNGEINATTESSLAASPATQSSSISQKPTKAKIPEKQNMDSEPSNTEESLALSPAAPPSRRKRLGDTSNEEHAKYMAEFHARPMELDRRSGARSAGGTSKDSTHLFVQDHKDWNALGLPPRLIQSMSSKFNLAQPTSVQSRTIQMVQDPANSEKNILIHSETGSGKTLAYLLPIVQRLGFSSDGSNKAPSRKALGTKCIILCPTRELASQTLTVVEKLCQSNFAGWMVPGGLLGGDSRSSEKSRIRKGLGIVVATPGRLLDHLNKTESLLLNLKGKLQWLVLDEADHLLDMGLGDQVKQIVQLIRANEASKSQPWWRSILVSATVTPSVQALAKERMLCGDQEWIWIKGSGDKAKTNLDDVGQSGPSREAKGETPAERKKEDGFSESTPRQLAQFHITVTAKLRLSTLVSFLVQRVSQGERTVVFMGTCSCVDFHHKLIQSMEPLWADEEEDADSSSNNGLFGSKAQVFKLHGNVQHSKRNQTLKLFDKAVGGAILLTTDVSARGLNLEGIDWTVQYDPPCEIADYVHRVGRVARAGKAGHSLLFLLPSEKGYLDVLQTKGISKVEPLSLSTTLNKAASSCPDWTNAGLKYGGNKEINGPRTGGDNLRGSRLGEHFAGEVQRRLEECIVQDNLAAQKKWKEEKKANKKRRKDTPSKGKEGELVELARDAFLSFLRAYPTKKEPSVRSIFSARALHVGHVARSFALKDPPKSLISKHKLSQKANSEMEAVDQQSNRPKSLQFNPYENNLVPLSDNEDDDDDDGDDDVVENYVNDQRGRHMKRAKFQGNHQALDASKTKNARSLLLQNAMKIQNNLMDAM